VKALHLNVARNEGEAVLLDNAILLGVVFPSHQPLPLGHVHVIAQLPPPSQQKT
jgi:hypothetical protein